jgi:hypothetical protein
MESNRDRDEAMASARNGQLEQILQDLDESSRKLAATIIRDPWICSKPLACRGEAIGQLRSLDWLGVDEAVLIRVQRASADGAKIGRQLRGYRDMVAADLEECNRICAFLQTIAPTASHGKHTVDLSA